MELIILGPLLLSVALITLGERKIMGTIQRRIGPNRVGVIGILQPIVDGLKLVLKETIIIGKSNKYIFMIVPMINLIMSLIGYSIIGIGGISSSSWWGEIGSLEIKNEVIIEQKNSIMILLLISSVGIITIILAGWSGNSKYAIIGSLRTTAQMISYEISIGLIIISIIIIIDSINIKIMVENQVSKHGVLNIRLWNIISIWPIGIIMIISSIAETNRAPMDLPEAIN